jgi:rare lipoprotein A
MIKLVCSVAIASALAQVIVLAFTGAAAAAESVVARRSGAPSSGPVAQRGRASWYGTFHHGRRTANGEMFNKNAFTAAHRTLPFGTRVRVRHEGTGRAVTVRINDRGPFAGDRIIDLSQAAARAIGLQGVGLVTLAGLRNEEEPAGMPVFASGR